MAVAIMREIREGNVVFHGLASPTPMVAMKAAKALGKEFAYITLSDGLDHDWSQPPYCASTLTANTYEGSVSSFALDCIFDLFCSGKGDIAFLSCLQMDKEGRIAMSYLGGDYDHPKLRGPGGAGSATLTPVTRGPPSGRQAMTENICRAGRVCNYSPCPGQAVLPSSRRFVFSEKSPVRSTSGSTASSRTPQSRM